MKKALKWILVIFGGLLVVVLAAAFVLPIIFKDDIKAAIEKEISKSVNADVVFEDLNVSLFSNFPNITAGLTDLGVMNRAPFDGEVLFATQKFEVEVNLKDILFGDELRVKGISLKEPVINIKVLADGRANYDIAIPSADTTTSAESGEFSFGIDHWELVDADVTYDDKSIPYTLALKGLDHSGSGDFTQDVFDLRIKATVDSVTTSFDGVEYLSDKQVEIDGTIAISEEYSKYTFKENAVMINDFAMSFDGWFKMNENDFAMDIAFKSPGNSFKSLLSLVPGIYTKDFNEIRTSGDLAFHGFVRGTYSEKQMPAFNVNLLVNDAMFQYPDLPTAVQSINVDLLVDNKDGVIENTVIDLKKLNLKFGSNPVAARAKITKMYPTQVDADVSATLNLAELTSMFPMEGLEMRGTYALNLNAKGIYDSLRKTIPAINATMSLSDGFVKSADFPIPMQDMHFASDVRNTSGRMSETVINVNDFSMLMDGEKLVADLRLENLDDYTWDLKVNGAIDLEKMTKVFPVEGMTLAGKIRADLSTRGKYSDMEAGRYDRLPTSGTATFTDFKYVTSDLPPVSITRATMVFDPEKIDLRQLQGTIGRSDFDVTGGLLNYFGFVMGNDIIKGDLNLVSNSFDLNEFMTEDEAAATEEETGSFGVIPVPVNIDFVMSSRIRSVKLMDFDMSNVSGDIIVKDGVANLKDLKFNMLGGSFAVNGSYNTRDIDHPKYDMKLEIENVSMKDAAAASSIVQTYAPIAGLVNGKFSTDFSLGGELKQDMMPDMATVNGAGLIKIAQAALKQSKVISGITSITKLQDTDEVTMKDVLMSATLKNGKLSVEPFDVKFGDYKTTVAGSTSLDGTLDYALKMDVPAGKLGTELNAFVSQYTGKTNPGSTIPITIGLGGLYNDPKPKLVTGAQSQQVKQAVTEAAKEEGAKALEEAVKGTEAEKALNTILGKDSTSGDTTKSTIPVTKEEIKEKQADLKEKAEEEAKKKIRNLLKKKDN